VSVNKSAIAAGPTTWRTAAAPQPIRSTLVDPSTLTPVSEGELCIYWIGNGIQRSSLLYVGVDIEGVLVFKKIKTSVAVNSYSGRAFDSLGSIRNSTLN
jgi:hypothetical protein